MKRQRSASTKESPKEAPVSLNKRHKSASLDECSIIVTTRKQLASLPTHGELVVDQGVAQIPSIASKSVSDIRQALASVRKQKKAGGSADVSIRLHACAGIFKLTAYHVICDRLCVSCHVLGGSACNYSTDNVYLVIAMSCIPHLLTIGLRNSGLAFG